MATATGTLMKNAARQLSRPTKAPPTSAPTVKPGGQQGAVEPEDALAQRALLERAGDQGQRGGRRHRGGEPLQRAGGQQRLGAGREAAEQRGRRQQRHPGQEQPAAAEQVRHPAEHQREAGRGQRVGGRDPGQVGHVQPDALPDHRQRDVQDREIDGQHEPGTEQDENDQALPAFDARG
nr:hypothetical protein [Actinomadura madurae]